LAVRFWINVPIAVVVLVLAVRFLPALPSRPGRFDVLGAVLLTGSMFLITLALVERSVMPGIIGAIVLVMAVAWERKASAPILPEHLWHHRVRGLTLIARLLFATSLFGMYFMTTQYFELTLGYSALTAGLLMLVNCVPQGATGMMVSSLVTRFGLRRLLLTGLGQGASFGPITSVGIWQSSPSEAGAASGIVNTGHQMGATTGVAGLTSLLVFSPHYSTPLAVSAILMVVALLIMLAATPDQHPVTHTQLGRADKAHHLVEVEDVLLETMKASKVNLGDHNTSLPIWSTKGSKLSNLFTIRSCSSIGATGIVRGLMFVIDT